MKHGYIRVACASPAVTVGDCAANERAVLACIRQMEALHAKIMVFPELCLTGYTCQDLFWQRQLIQDAQKALIELARKTQRVDALIFVGLPLRVCGKLYNVAAVLNYGNILGFVPKTHLPNYNEFYEQRWFVSGQDMDEVITIQEEDVPVCPDMLFTCDTMPELKIGVEICEDLWVPQPPSIVLAQSGANIIVNLSASNEVIGKKAYRQALVQGQSARLVCGYVYAAAGEGESTQDLVFGGQNMIAENGSMLTQGRQFENQTVYAEIDVHRLNDERQRLSTFPGGGTEWLVRENFFGLKLEPTPLSRNYPSYPFVPSSEEEKEERCEEILNIQTMGLKRRLVHIHGTKMMVGLSGGLDSTLALLVMARTADRMGLSRDQLICVTMPCFGTSGRTYANACSLARCLGAQLREIPIRESVLMHFRDIGHDPADMDVTYENAQARERTQVLMDLANQENALLVGTGDLSELALGWATYNGDHMSMYGVNASVPKTLVRHLVRYVADRCQEESLKGVLYDILDTPVSPELLPPKDGEISQKTEDLVGPYELHDFFLYYMLRMGFEPQKLFRIACRTFAGVFEREEILKWLKVFYRRFFTQQFKRSCLPDGPKVGSVALSPRGDLRMPSDASCEAWLSQLEKL
ncbi:MAG: NAD(+) synthase [Blautia sp.]|nr:NAD(+) synthase [Blautia sp.]